MSLILLVAGLTLVASFLCSLFEAALYAITPAQIEVLRARGVRHAEKLAGLRTDVEEPIAAILTINTLAHTVGASWCGALVGVRYGDTAVGVFAAVFTMLVLFLTEIVPKSLGVRFAALLGPRIVWPLRAMIWTVWPLVWVARRAMRRLTGGAPHTGPSEEELLGVSRLASRSGTIRSEEHRWVRNALRLDAVTAGQLRTPRPVVETIAADTAIADLVKDPRRLLHSRIPVTEGRDKDRVIGLLHRRELFEAAQAGEAGPSYVRELTRPLHFVPESMPAHELLDLFLGQRQHMVGLLDQYGGFEGVVTLEDVLECLLGAEIVDERDLVEDLQELARRRRERRGRG